MKKMKKIFYVGALVGAMGFGAMFGPVLSFADDTATTTPTYQPQFQNQQAGGMGLRMGQYFAGSMSEVVAKALGMTVEDLYQLRLEGKSLEEIAQDKGKTSEELLKLMVTAKQAQVAELVEKKVITQDQADYMLERSNANMEAAIKRTEVGPMNGGKGMMGGRRFNQDGTTNFTPGQGRGFGGGPRWSNQQQ